MTRPPSVSLEPSKRKRQINLAPRATRPHKSPSSSSVLAGVKQEFAHRLWRTLGDVLQEVNIDNLTFRGKPITRGQSLSPTAGPSTPAFPPQQYVDTRPLAYVHLLQQENHQLLAPPQPTQTPPTPDSVPNQWPPVHTQLQQQHYTFDKSAEYQMLSHAAVRTPPFQTPDLASNCQHATPLAPPTQQTSVGAPAMSSPQQVSPSLPNSQGISGQHPLLCWSSCHSGGSPNHAQRPASHTPIQTVQRVLDTLFSGSTAQQASPLPQSSSRHAHAQQATPLAHPALGGADQRPPYSVIPPPAVNSRSDTVQQCHWHSASGMYGEPQPASELPPDKQAAGCVQPGLPSPHQQTATLHAQSPQPCIQQDAHQPSGLPPIHHVQVPLTHYPHACAHLQADTLQYVHTAALQCRAHSSRVLSTRLCLMLHLSIKIAMAAWVLWTQTTDSMR